MSPTLIAQRALWLDPFQPLADDAQAQLAAGGLVAMPVSTLDELRSRLDHADVLVVRLEGDTELLQELQSLASALGHALPIVCRVERRNLELAIAAMRQGARHVLACDEWSPAAWQTAIAAPVAADPAKTGKSQSSPRPVRATRSVVYVDPVSQHLLALAQRVALANVTALIEGPTGAGKEVLARVLHESSNRASGPFVALNCAALPEHLIEDMLFGHEKGAFTGALKDHRGVFEQAQGGTLFLDEIGEMPIGLQAKLLRILQERQIVRLGGERPIDLDVRVVVATNKDLREAIAQREFREDLYFRISTFKLRVPPLCERPGDVLPLVARLLARHAPTGRVPSIDGKAQAALRTYRWPGNVRELENVVQRALVLCTGEVITCAHLMFDEARPVANVAAPAAPLSVAAVAPLSAPSAPVADAAQPSQFIEPPAFTAAEPAPAAAGYAPVAATPPQPLPDFASFAVANADDPSDAVPSASLQAAVKSSEQQLIMAAIQSTFSRMEAAQKLGISPRTLRYKLAKLKGGPALSMAGSELNA